MNSDTFIVIQDLKKKLLSWRVITFLSVTILILILGRSGIKKIKKTNTNDKTIIARISIKDIITRESYSNQKLKDLEKDNVAAVILDIDSPGGEVTASETLYEFFKKLTEKKPVISVINSIGASGSYMVAMSSNYIIAYNTSIIGSIGVLIQSYEVTEMADKIGIKFINIKSSPLKAIPNPYEKFTEDVEVTVRHSMDDIYDYFLSIFIESRNIDHSKALEIGNGQVYTGRQALKIGLIDKIGNENDAIEYLKSKNIDTDNIKITDYDIKETRNRIIDNFKGFINLINKNSLGNHNRIMAIYK